MNCSQIGWARPICRRIASTSARLAVGPAEKVAGSVGTTCSRRNPISSTPTRTGKEIINRWAIWRAIVSKLLPFRHGILAGMIAARNAPRIDSMSVQKLNENAKGVYIIAATPFADEGALDLQSVDTLTDFYLGCGVHGFTLLGIMGEAPKLTPDESISVVDRVIRRAQGRQVIVGVSHAGLENVRRLSQEVMVAGTSGVMVAPPPGLKGDEGLYNYFAQLFKALGPDIPVVY